MQNNLTFRIPSRVHLTLIGMGEQSYRVNGGIGFSIKGFDLKIFVQKENSITISDKRPKGLSSDELLELALKAESIQKKLNLKNSVNFVIEGGPSCHTGFGTKTSTLLCLVESLLHINNINADRETIIGLSGRGGTSGIGINTYFDGGFVFDMGRKSLDKIFNPSSSYEEVSFKPLLLKKIDMPNWGMGICIPKNIQGPFGSAEKDFFKKTCPIPKEDVYETLFHSLFGCTAAVLEKDYETFCESINKIQSCSWKKNEISIYNDDLYSYISSIAKFSDSAAMSSMGPGIIFFSRNIEYSIDRISRETSQKCDILQVFANNHGRDLNVS